MGSISNQNPRPSPKQNTRSRSILLKIIAFLGPCPKSLWSPGTDENPQYCLYWFICLLLMIQEEESKCYFTSKETFNKEMQKKNFIICFILKLHSRLLYHEKYIKQKVCENLQKLCCFCVFSNLQQSLLLFSFSFLYP